MKTFLFFVVFTIVKNISSEQNITRPVSHPDPGKRFVYFAEPPRHIISGPDESEILAEFSARTFNRVVVPEPYLSCLLSSGGCFNEALNLGLCLEFRSRVGNFQSFKLSERFS